MTSYDTGPIDAVYDRAALIAMPEDLRRQYAEQLRAVAGNAPQLLVTLEYDQSEMAGPPFSVPVDQMESYYGTAMNIDLIADKDCLIDEPKFRERGLSSLRERVVRLTPKV